MAEKTPIVCDNGTGFVKAGYAGVYFPDHIFPSMVGVPTMKFAEVFKDVELKKAMVGDICAKHRGLLEVGYPIHEGRIQHWEGKYGINHIWDYTFNEKMKIDPSEHKVMLTEPPRNPVKNTERMIKAMIETYGFRGCKIEMQAMLVLYAQGLNTGTVLDIGDGVAHAVPVCESYVLKDSIKRLDVAGRAVTQRLMKLLQIRGYNFNQSADQETVRLIKENMCYIGYDLKVEKKLAVETTTLTKEYELPDKRVIRIDRERYEAPEVLFRPDLGEERYAEQAGIHEQLYNCITDCAIDLRKKLFSQIVLSGGTTMLPGMPTRLEKEVKQLYLERTLGGRVDALKNFNLKVEDPPRRKHLVYFGASVVAKMMETHEKYWISKEEWAECGASIIQRKQAQMG